MWPLGPTLGLIAGPLASAIGAPQRLTTPALTACPIRLTPSIKRLSSRPPLSACTRRHRCEAVRQGHRPERNPASRRAPAGGKQAHPGQPESRRRIRALRRVHHRPADRTRAKRASRPSLAPRRTGIRAFTRSRNSSSSSKAPRSSSSSTTPASPKAPGKASPQAGTSTIGNRSRNSWPSVSRKVRAGSARSVEQIIHRLVPVDAADGFA